MKEVAAAIILKDESVLLTRRKAGEKLAGYWEFPGGKVEDGETLQECLERELREELGVGSKAGAVLAESTHQYGDGAIKLIGIRTELLDQEFTLTVHDKAEWISIGELMHYRLAPADIPIARKIIETLKNV